MPKSRLIVAVIEGKARAAQADRDDALGIDEPFLDAVPEQRAVIVRVAPEAVIGVGVGVEMNDADRPALDGAFPDGIGGAVIAARGEDRRAARARSAQKGRSA